MATATLTAIATAAVQALGVLDSGEGLSTQQLADALAAANGLIDNYSSDRLFAISANVTAVSVTTGTSSYTLGSRVSAIESATMIPNSGPTVPLKVVNAVEWSGIIDRGVAGSMIRLLAQASAGSVDVVEYSQFTDPIVASSVLRLGLEKRPDLITPLLQIAKLSTGNTFQARYLFYDRGNPTATIYLAGPPQTGSVQLVSWTAMSQFADATTPLTMIPGYQRLLVNALAMELAPQYDMAPPQAVLDNFSDAAARLRQLNASILGPEPSGGLVSPAKGSAAVDSTGGAPGSV